MDMAKGNSCNGVLRIGLRMLLSRGARVKANVGVNGKQQAESRTGTTAP